MKLLNQLKSLVSKNSSKITEGMGKVTKTIDDKTGGKYSDKLEKASNTLEGQLGKLTSDDIDLTDEAVDLRQKAESEVTEAAADAAEEITEK